jgi:pimeloyl-ACP methyl ester carboxylesterase
MRIFWLALLLAAPALAATPAAITTDPAHDAAHPARSEVLRIPTGGVLVNGLAYVAAGPGPHPTLVIAHGWPGNEKNTDIAQSVRRAGWNTVLFNYRGAWGSPGAFHFAQVPEDTAAVIAYLRTPEVAKRLGIDPDRIALAGHSMGGWATAMTAASDPRLIGAITISMGDMGMVGALPRDRLLQESVGSAPPLAGTTAEMMTDELIAGAAANRVAPHAAGLARVPLLVLSSDDGLAFMSDSTAAAVRAAGGKVTTAHAATDHDWSDKRIELQTLIIDWLAALQAK